MTTNVNLIVALDEKFTKSLGLILWVLEVSVSKFMAIHSMVVEIFLFGPKWWTGSNIAIYYSVEVTSWKCKNWTCKDTVFVEIRQL